MLRRIPASTFRSWVGCGGKTRGPRLHHSGFSVTLFDYTRHCIYKGEGGLWRSAALNPDRRFPFHVARLAEFGFEFSGYRIGACWNVIEGRSSAGGVMGAEERPGERKREKSEKRRWKCGRWQVVVAASAAVTAAWRVKTPVGEAPPPLPTNHRGEI